MLTALFAWGENLGLAKASASPKYTETLFDDSRVHTINLQVEDWEKFLNDAPEEEYVSADVTIDGETIKNVGLRVKGNNSKSLVEKYGLTRYSMKLEFDHYNDGGNYHGLDKLSLDAAFQDNSYLKNYLAYDMMAHMGVPSPLCSYTWVTVNDEPWGLFLAIEEPEEAFAQRNFGKNHGRLYKPDYRRLEDENADVALKYIDDDPHSYPNIFDRAKFKVSYEDEQRLIATLKALWERRELEEYVNVDEVLRYFTVQVFVVNLDSYLGRTGHNYYLYEENGQLSMLPWDYNLAFCTYSLGMPEPVNDAQLYVNYPIDTPADGSVMVNRPMYHHLMLEGESFDAYHEHFDRFIETYFESGLFETKVAETAKLIAPYVHKDPTAYCSYEDHLLAVNTIRDFCLLRAESIRLQLDGKIPSTFKDQETFEGAFVDASSIWLPDMGEVEDLKD